MTRYLKRKMRSNTEGFTTMGTDIHAVFQREVDGKWKNVPSEYDEGRDYQLYGILAGVRMTNVKPIAAPRGLPPGFEVDADGCHPVLSAAFVAPWRREHCEAGQPLLVWMGYHDFSWLSTEEILAYFAKKPTAIQSGIIDRAQYAVWDHKTPPESYCQGIWGPGVVTVDEADLRPDNWTHVRVMWEADLANECGYFVNEVQRLSVEYGKVRMVFGFDS